MYKKCSHLRNSHGNCTANGNAFEIYLQIPSVLHENKGNSGFLQHLSPSSGTTETLSLLEEWDLSLPKFRSPIPSPPCDLPGFCVEVWQGVTTGTQSYIYSLGSHPSLLQSSQKGNQPIQHGICQSCAAREVKNERQRRQKLSKWVFVSKERRVSSLCGSPFYRLRHFFLSFLRNPDRNLPVPQVF